MKQFSASRDARLKTKSKEGTTTSVQQTIVVFHFHGAKMILVLLSETLKLTLPRPLTFPRNVDKQEL